MKWGVKHGAGVRENRFCDGSRVLRQQRMTGSVQKTKEQEKAKPIRDMTLSAAQSGDLKCKHIYCFLAVESKFHTCRFAHYFTGWQEVWYFPERESEYR